ncbi:hypothetical protein CcaverHIS002_0109590 [Cutaneotrichosporon cavernicola]|nr:hypothetical protein CcaverHIS002_0109590 [Cutaneotrichosporon cavernicola]BEI96004.1 hypothetical protein CcaverHIS631_0109530 [Cutaneotrichosporon cavernicola]BEJ03778.1 hypothetical protein CcaverHIS641_0109530 [Cutaneotrichosporon cavernicola]
MTAASLSASALTSAAPSPEPLDPRDITEPEQIAAQLALLTRREADLTLALNALIADRTGVDGALSNLRDLTGEVDALSSEVDGYRVPSRYGTPTRKGRVSALSPPQLSNSPRVGSPRASPAPRLQLSSRGLGLQDADGDDGDGLVARVSRVWETSERVGGKVRKLDDEIGRVREAADVVTEVLELKSALAALEVAIDKADWEGAARACRRAMSVRDTITEGGFAGSVVPTPQNPLPPPQQLAELRDFLLHTFRQEFDSAAERRDEHEVSRYFRLWPGIGAEDQGLEAYGNFVVSLVKSRSSAAGKPSSPLYYLSQLTSLLESIAHIIDQHQPVVDKYYGTGRMRTVVGRLVGESDRVVRNLVEGWEEERRVGRLISDTKASRFAFLSNPAALPPLFSSLASGTAAAAAGQISLSSLANTTSNVANALQSYAPRVKTATATGPTPTPVPEEDPGPDPRDVDRVLGELVALSGRWALFRRFVHSRLSESDEDDTDLEVVEQSGSQRAIENMLRTYYEPLELWYLRSSVEKAHRLDLPDTSTKPHLSSILDDTFYLIKVVLNRVLSSGSLSALHALREHISTVLEKDYASILSKKMERVYAQPVTYDRAEKAIREKDQKETYIIFLNDLDVSADYAERLLLETRENVPAAWLPREHAAVLDELDVLSDLAAHFRSVARSGLEQFFGQVIRPRLRPLLDECYKDMTYALGEDAFADAEDQDLVRRRFVRGWENLMDGYRTSFTDHNYQIFYTMTVETLVRPWEKMVMGMAFTELGAIRYERDVRAVANYLSTQASYGGARDKFTRLQQIATVLNLDADEDPDEFYSNSGIPWRLSRNEYNTVVGLRQF